jgi:hypothetical protein
MNKFFIYIILLSSCNAFSTQQIDHLKSGVLYYNLAQLNENSVWIKTIHRDRLKKYGMSTTDFSVEQVKRLSKLGFVIKTINGPGNLYIRPMGNNYITFDKSYFEYSQDVADVFQKISQLMNDAKADFSKTIKFLFDKDISIGEKQKYIYSSEYDKKNVKNKLKINLKNYEEINQKIVRSRINNLVALSKSFVFANEKVSEVFPGLVEAYLAYEYIYKIFEEQLEIINKDLNNHSNKLVILMLSNQEKDLLLISLARAVDLLQPLAQQFLISVGEQNIVLALCESSLKKYDFYKEEEEEEITQTLIPVIQEIIEVKEEIPQIEEIKEEIVEVQQEPIITIKKVNPHKKSKQEKTRSTRRKAQNFT